MLCVSRTLQKKKRTHVPDAEDPAKKGQPKSFVFRRGRHGAILRDLERDLRKVRTAAALSGLPPPPAPAYSCSRPALRSTAACAPPQLRPPQSKQGSHLRLVLTSSWWSLRCLPCRAQLMAPNTASSLKESKRNQIKDFLHVAGPLGVTHFLILTATHNASYLRVAK